MRRLTSYTKSRVPFVWPWLGISCAWGAPRGAGKEGIGMEQWEGSLLPSPALSWLPAWLCWAVLLTHRTCCSVPVEKTWPVPQPWDVLPPGPCPAGKHLRPPQFHSSPTLGLCLEPALGLEGDAPAACACEGLDTRQGMGNSTQQPLHPTPVRFSSLIHRLQDEGSVFAACAPTKSSFLKRLFQIQPFHLLSSHSW